MIPKRCQLASRRRRLPKAAVAMVLLLVALSSGCVERRLLVRSNPPGALLYVDDVEIGTTPISTDFIYYGTRKIRLVKDGYETFVVEQPLPTPWYEYVPLDFVTENLVPGHIRDVRVLSYSMQPTVQVPNDQLVSRADTVRRTLWTQQLGIPLAPGQRPYQAPAALGLTPQQPLMTAPLGTPQPGIYSPPGVLPQPGAYSQPGVLPQPGYSQPGAVPAPGYPQQGVLPAPSGQPFAPQPQPGALPQ